MRRRKFAVLAVFVTMLAVMGCDQQDAESEQEEADQSEQEVQEEVQEEAQEQPRPRRVSQFEDWNVRAMDLPRPARPHQNVITSAQPSAEQLAALGERGIGRIINLRDEGEPGFEDLSDAAQAVGLEYFHLPITRPEDLNRESVEAFSELIDGTEQVVLVFCEDSDRTGAMIALRANWHSQVSPIDAIRRGKVAGLAQSEDVVRDTIYRNPVEDSDDEE